MASAAVHTPVKHHSSLFNTRLAGGSIPLTPSPRARAAKNGSPATPTAPGRRDAEWHADRKLYANAPRGSLNETFAALSLSSSKSRSSRAPPSPKSNIARPQTSPLRLDLGVSEWALTGTGPNSSLRSARKDRPRQKTTIRINGDRFLPARRDVSPKTKLEVVPPRPNSSNGTRARNSVLTGGVFGRDDDNDAEDDEVFPDHAKAETEQHEDAVAGALGIKNRTKILAFKQAPPETVKAIDLRTQYNRPLKPAASSQQRRRILTAPERVLDAPGLIDDYYLNLLDWSSGNQVAIGLERNVYVWNAETGSVDILLETAPERYVSSVKWSGDGAYVAVGLDSGDVQIWDVEDKTRLRTMSGHDSRVCAMSWSNATLSTGARSGNIFNHDVRIAEHKTAELLSHTSEICGLEWRSDGAQLASGGNDNLVNIWDARSMVTPKWSKTNHKAAVKALAWCPWQLNLLATGGGTLDKCIHFWNATTGARVNSIDTGSQVTSLKWSTNYREIVSCHGLPDNHITVWSYPTLVKNVEIPAHETRILHSALSPDGQMLATCAADESLKFWKLFEKKAGAAAGSGGATNKGNGMAKQMTIR